MTELPVEPVTTTEVNRHPEERSDVGIYEMKNIKI